MSRRKANDLAALDAVGKMTEPQQIALGARLLHERLRPHVQDKKSLARATIRLQTFYGKPTP